MEMNITEDLVRAIGSGLFNWYDFSEGTKVLYLGQESDAYVDAFEEKAVELSIVSLTEGLDMADNGKTGLADYIICVAEIEKQYNPTAVLRKLRSLLKENGHLLIGANNRLGIRYFCGDRDPYTNTCMDGVEGYRLAYRQSNQKFEGRCYSKSEWKECIEQSGFLHHHFFSIASDLKNPVFVFAEGYLPNEDLSTRTFPSYHYPKTVFLEEESLYGTLVKEGLFHEMCNAFLIDCSDADDFSDILHVTSSMERGRERALLTIIRNNGQVEKRAAYPEGVGQIESIIHNHKELTERGLSVVDAAFQNGSYIMPYMKYPVGQLYLKELLHQDKDKFLLEMDRFRDLIFQSSEIEIPDKGDGEGAILKKAFLDMVPLNSFYVNGEFVFFDQEFSQEHYPANVMLWRLVASFYFGDSEVEKLLPMDVLLERFGIKEKLSKWQQMEWQFLDELKKTKELAPYFALTRCNTKELRANRFRLNYSAFDYQRFFVDIFRDADTKKLILFGSGAYTKHFLSLFRFDYPVSFIVDNDAERWGKKLEGISICSPDNLRDLPPESYKVIICIKNYLPVMQQLDALGVQDYSVYERGKDYPRKIHVAVDRDREGENVTPKKYHIGYVAGVFDMFHVGHVNLLRKAKEQCDFLIVALVPDEGVFFQKQKYPIISCEDRIEVVKACRYADLVEALPIDRMGIRDAYEIYHFDVMFSGDDHATDPGWLAEQAYLRERGSDIVFFDYTKKVSSSMLRKTIQEER